MVKKIIFLLAVIISSTAIAQPFKSKAYKTGVYIFCGMELPRNFSYLIEKKSASDNDWKVVASLRAPENEAACKAALLNLPVIIASVTHIEDAQISRLWQLIAKAQVLDSLLAFAFDPRYQSAAGCAWFDDGIAKAGKYAYRISKVAGNGDKTPVNEVTIPFGTNPYAGALKAVRYRIMEGYISISYEIGDLEEIAGVKLYRSHYKANKFSEIQPDVMFTTEENKMVALVRDGSAIKNVTYSYIAIPYDLLGNMGKATADTLNIYNFTKPSDIGIIINFDATAIPEKKGIELKWILANTHNVTSVDIYRSESYDGKYEKIASLPAKATDYFDHKELKPSVANYYYILINNGYGNSLPSARIPAILKGTKLNILPPQSFAASRNGRIVTLTFQRLGQDTRRYYIYRANGYIAPLTQLPRMLISSDSVLIYHDTLPLTAKPCVYSYAVASENSSYSISPMTERISISYSGGMLPVPSNVNAILRDHSVFIVWDNVAEQNSAISSYRVFRSLMDDNGIKRAVNELLAVTSYEENSFIDSTVREGAHYRYRVQCVGADTTDLGSLSAAAGIVIPRQTPLQPGRVSAYAADKKILIQWDQPADESVTAVRIYRAPANQDAEMLKELPATESQFEDLKAKPGQTYFYFIRTVNKAGMESQPTDAVSAKMK